MFCTCSKHFILWLYLFIGKEVENINEGRSLACFLSVAFGHQSVEIIRASIWPVKMEADSCKVVKHW